MLPIDRKASNVVGSHLFFCYNRIAYTQSKRGCAQRTIGQELWLRTDLDTNPCCIIHFDRNWIPASKRNLEDAVRHLARKQILPDLSRSLLVCIEPYGDRVITILERFALLRGQVSLKE